MPSFGAGAGRMSLWDEVLAALAAMQVVILVISITTTVNQELARAVSVDNPAMLVDKAALAAAEEVGNDYFEN